MLVNNGNPTTNIEQLYPDRLKQTVGLVDRGKSKECGCLLDDVKST